MIRCETEITKQKRPVKDICLSMLYSGKHRLKKFNRITIVLNKCNTVNSQDVRENTK